MCLYDPSIEKMVIYRSELYLKDKILKKVVYQYGRMDKIRIIGFDDSKRDRKIRSTPSKHQKFCYSSLLR